jgi:hypothetical protein
MTGSDKSHTSGVTLQGESLPDCLLGCRTGTSIIHARDLLGGCARPVVVDSLGGNARRPVTAAASQRSGLVRAGRAFVIHSNWSPGLLPSLLYTRMRLTHTHRHTDTDTLTHTCHSSQLSTRTPSPAVHSGPFSPSHLHHMLELAAARGDYFIAQRFPMACSRQTPTNQTTNHNVCPPRIDRQTPHSSEQNHRWTSAVAIVV